MKEAFDKEFDSLLRRHARGAAGVRTDGARAAGEASHLDADELSAFAEGALPAPARFAAVSHLAECDRCRGIAVGLARASGFAVAAEKGAAAVAAAAPAVRSEASSHAGRRAWLSSLFAPRVLRYAAPILALCVVGVVSFVALRSSRQGAGAPSSQVAVDEGRRVENQKEAAGVAAPENNAAANANADGLVARATDEATRGSITSASPAPQPVAPGQAGGGAGQGGAVASAPAAAEVTTEQPAPPSPVGRAEVASDAPAASKAGPAEEREADKKAENAPSKSDENKEKASRGTEPVDVATNNDQYAQKRAQSRAYESQTPDGSRNRSSGTQSNVAGGSLAAPPPAPKTEDRDTAATRRARKAEPSGEREGSDDETVRVSETRAAAGHRFRRDGGAWVDVNYKSSMPSTGVRRGTESYRVLVADMPEIGRAAEQLGGEVVVVIRGHAYRVR
jgi:hypothetical protein